MPIWKVSKQDQILADQYIKLVNLWPECVPPEWEGNGEAFLDWARPQDGKYLEIEPGRNDAHYMSDTPSAYMGEANELYIGPRGVCMRLRDFAPLVGVPLYRALRWKRQLVYDGAFLERVLECVTEADRFEVLSPDALEGVTRPPRRGEVRIASIIRAYNSLEVGEALKVDRPRRLSQSLRKAMQRRGLVVGDYAMTYKKVDGVDHTIIVRKNEKEAGI